jgi:hypothetical protein
MKINQNFTLVSGDTRTLAYAIADAAGQPYDLSALTAAKWGMARLREDGSFAGSALASKTLGAGITVADAAAGTLEVALLPADTEALAGAYYHELELSFGAVVYTAAIGRATIQRDLL